MPEAAKLQGETRTQVSQLISSFNELITTQNDWKAAYQKVENNLNTLLAPADWRGSSDAGAHGRPADEHDGNAEQSACGGCRNVRYSNAGLDPAIRTKLEEFRTHLKEFEKSAGGVAGEHGAFGLDSAVGFDASSGEYRVDHESVGTGRRPRLSRIRGCGGSSERSTPASPSATRHHQPLHRAARPDRYAGRDRDLRIDDARGH